MGLSIIAYHHFPPASASVCTNSLADISTLGGAGFASQQYRFGPIPLQLPRLTYNGLTLHLLPDPETPQSLKHFTLVLKTSLAPQPKKPKHPTDPEPASLSYEATFDLPKTGQAEAHTVQLGWDSFVPTYRGREVGREDPRYQPLKSEGIYELGLMCRSGFGGQEGDFGVVIAGVEGWGKEPGVASQSWWAWLCECWTGMRIWLGLGGVHLRDEV